MYKLGVHLPIKMFIIMHLFCYTNIFAETVYRHDVNLTNKNTSHYLWNQKIVGFYDQLLISCNIIPNSINTIKLKARWHTNEGWSSWLDIAYWVPVEKELEADFSTVDTDLNLQRKITTQAYGVFTPAIKQGCYVDEVEVMVEAFNQQALAGLKSLYMCVSTANKKVVLGDVKEYGSLLVTDVPGYSQKKILHNRASDMCAPTALTMVINTELKGMHESLIDPLDFAACAYDSVRDIYGNWFLNNNAVYSCTKAKLESHLVRFDSFASLCSYLKKGIPVVVSVVGPLKGSASPYANGHLIVVIGWDPVKQEVICKDSAFASDDATLVVYPINDFIEAWNRRNGFAYIVEPSVF